MSGLFHVFFDGNNWIGVVLEENENSMKAGKYIFGPEPTPTEIFEWAKKGCPGLVLTDVSKSEKTASRITRRLNPKRMMKEARRVAENKPLSSYAQDKLKEVIELRKKSAAVTKLEFSLSPEELEFFNMHRNYDIGFSSLILVYEILHSFVGDDRKQISLLIEKASEGNRIEILPSEVNSILVRYSPVARVMDEFFGEILKNKMTPFPSLALNIACQHAGLGIQNSNELLRLKN